METEELIFNIVTLMSRASTIGIPCIVLMQSQSTNGQVCPQHCNLNASLTQLF